MLHFIIPLSLIVRGILFMESDRDYGRSVLLSVNRALIGSITPTMRRISVEFDRKIIKVLVYHDGLMADEEKDDFDADVITQIIADYPYPEKDDPSVELEFIRCDYPKNINAITGHRQITVYGRKEEYP